MKTDNLMLWRKRIADRKSSGLKVDEWCKQNQLTKHAYYYWRRKLIDLDAKKIEQELFVEVPVEPADQADSPSSSMRIEWNGVSIHVSDGHCVNLAAELLVKLLKSC